jgi:hypothetical protein
MISDNKARVTSLWRLSLRLKRLTESEHWQAPTGQESRRLQAQLDSLCDEIERIIWKLEENNHA